MEADRGELCFGDVLSLKHFILDNIQIGQQIGSGAHGRILEPKWEGAVVAIKETHAIFAEASEIEFQSLKRNFLQECEQSSRLRHPNIVRFFGIYYPPGARMPSLVMERLHYSLTGLLEQRSFIPIETKLSIISDVALGLRYLHTRTPPIIHRDLSSNNVLISRGMEGKIGDLGTARLVDPRRQSRMSKAPGTVDFMPPEALAAGDNTKYGRELDVFSFGCVMLHTLSHQWPTPSEAVVTDPTTLEMKAQSEIDRRKIYFDTINGSKADMVIPSIKGCLGNLPNNRTSVLRLCDQLEALVDREHVPANDSKVSSLQQEIEKKDVQLQSKDVEIELLKSHLSKLQSAVPSPLPNGVDESNTNFWSDIKLTWQQCADLPEKCWATSVAELDGNVYVSAVNSKGGCVSPYMYDSHKDHWVILPELPYVRFNLVAVPDKKQLLAIGGRANKYGVAKISNRVFLWDQNWTWQTPYPSMPTPRFRSSSISSGSTVIVAGGLTCVDSVALLTRAVEVLHISDQNLSDSYWSVVEQLPYGVYEAIPLIIDDNLYIAAGYNKNRASTCDMVTVSIPELLQNSDKNRQVWYKLPDMPYSSYSINYYQGRLITFTGDRLRKQKDKDVPEWELVPLAHIYNPDLKCWECVGDISCGYHFGKTIYVRKNEILFIGGLTGSHMVGEDNDMMTTCSLLVLTTI